MFKLKNFSVFIFFLLLAFNVRASEESDYDDNNEYDDSASIDTENEDTDVSNDSSNEGSSTTWQLCTVFRELRSVVPNYALLGITAAHYSTDAEFRNAIAFLGTDQFKSVVEKIENSEAFKGIINLYADGGVDTKDLANFSTLFECLLLDEVKTIQGRSLNTYAGDIKRAIPHDAFKKKIAEELKANKQFKKFYRVVRSKKYKNAVLTAFAAEEIRNELAYLRHNKIDLRQLTLNIIEIFHWGPKPLKC